MESFFVLQEHVETVENYRPNPEIYERIDEQAWLNGMMKDIYQQNHAIHDTLTGSNRIEVKPFHYPTLILNHSVKSI